LELMRKFSALAASALALSVTVAACSPAPQKTAGQPATPVSPAPAPPAAPAAPAAANVLGLEGLGDLRLGQAPPASWSERGAQISDECRTVTSPDHPGVYAIVEDGKVQRITVGQRSDVKLAEGIGVGAAEDQVRQWFGGFGEEPHKYVDAPAKYLTAPNADSGGPALRFEIGQDGKVSLIHVGLMPVLAYVEGCA
jgi:hypothetical protein